MVAVADRPGARQVGLGVSVGRQTHGWALRVGLRPPAAACRGRRRPVTLLALPTHCPSIRPAPPRSRFLWVSSGEPHAIRRRELLSKYGEQIRKLYGYDHATAYQVGRERSVCVACFELWDTDRPLQPARMGRVWAAARTSKAPGLLLPAAAAGTLAQQPPGWRPVASAVSHAGGSSVRPAGAPALCWQQHLAGVLNFTQKQSWC